MTIHQLTPEYIKANPLPALKIIIADNPIAIKNNLETFGFSSVPADRTGLFEYIKDYLMLNNGSPAVIQQALDVPIMTPAPKSGGTFWTSLGQVAGATLGALFPGLGGAGNQELIAQQQQALIEEQNKTTRTTFIVIGLVVVAAIVAFIVLRKK
jgi:hypothetical protein